MSEVKKQVGASLLQRLNQSAAIYKAAAAPPPEHGDGDNTKQTDVNIESAAKTGAVSDIQRDTFKNEKHDLPGAASNAATEPAESPESDGKQHGAEGAAVVVGYDPANTDAASVLEVKTNEMIKTANALAGSIGVILSAPESDLNQALSKLASGAEPALPKDPTQQAIMCGRLLRKLADQGVPAAQAHLDFMVSFDAGQRKKAHDIACLQKRASVNDQIGEYLRKVGAAEDAEVAEELLNAEAAENPAGVFIDPESGGLDETIAMEDLPPELQGGVAMEELRTEDPAGAEALAATQDIGAALEEAAVEEIMDLSEQLQAEDPSIPPEEADQIAAEYVQDAVIAAIAEQSHGMQVGDEGDFLTDDEALAEDAEILEKSASGAPLRAQIIGALYEKTGLNSNAFQARLAGLGKGR